MRRGQAVRVTKVKLESAAHAIQPSGSECGEDCSIRERPTIMKEATDFSAAKRGAVADSKGKTRVTIYLDDPIIEAYKARSEKSGKGYQTLINEALRESLGFERAVLTPEQSAELARRVADDDAFPDDVVSADEVFATIRSGLEKRRYLRENVEELENRNKD